MSKTLLLGVAIAGAVLVGGGIAVASSGIVGFLGIAGMMAVDVAQDDMASRALPVETFRIGAMLDRPSKRVQDTALFSIATYQVRGLSDLHPGLQRRFRGRALTLPLEGGRHLVSSSLAIPRRMVAALLCRGRRPDLMVSCLATGGPGWGYGTATFSRRSTQKPCRRS